MAVAPSAWLAKCAAEAHKPEAAVVWLRSDLPGVYASLVLEDLPGAGPAVCARLRACGIDTLGALHDAHRSRAIAAWGSIEGERVRWALRGVDVGLRSYAKRSLGHGRVLTGGDRRQGRARVIARWLAACALWRARRLCLSPLRVRLEVELTQVSRRTVTVVLDGGPWESVVLGAVSRAWAGAFSSVASDVEVLPDVGVARWVVRRTCGPVVRR